MAEASRRWRISDRAEVATGSTKRATIEATLTNGFANLIVIATNLPAGRKTVGGGGPRRKDCHAGNEASDCEATCVDHLDERSPWWMQNRARFRRVIVWFAWRTTRCHCTRPPLRGRPLRL